MIGGAPMIKPILQQWMESSMPGSLVPTFSLVMEGFTITEENAGSLATCLASVAAQSLSPEHAQDVVLVETGHVPLALLEQLCRPYPWVRFHSLPPGTRYFEAKLAGAAQASGEVLVFCDADNVYLPGWLESIVLPFADPTMQVVTGETSVNPTNLLGTLFALTFFFPPFTYETELTEDLTYFGNNVAFRRSFLQQNPIPTGLPLLRGNDFVHSVRLRRQGHKVWRQPLAKAFHDPPASFHELWLRYLARGSDRLEIWRLTHEAAGLHIRQPGFRGVLWASFRVVFNRIGEFIRRLVSVVRQSPRSLIYYPLAIPSSLLLLGATFAGVVISHYRPGRLVSDYLAHYAAGHGTLDVSTTGS